MENQITIREAVLKDEITAFWERLSVYRNRNRFPASGADGLGYAPGSGYYDRMIKLCSRPRDRCHFLLFQRDGQDIGLAMPVIYTSEDSRCFIAEYGIYPQFRGNGLGRECAWVLLNWAKEHGAQYAEVNGGSEQWRYFWKIVGFAENGTDVSGEPLMIVPLEENVPITVEILSDPEDRQLKRLENGFLREIGEAPSMEKKQGRLVRAIRAGKITFFVAKRGCRAVGMCSVAPCFSTFACADMGVFDDFYIEPVFRRRGIAGKLVKAAQSWCEANGLAGLTVTCAPCDEEMYQALGFHTPLGKTFAHLG